MLTECFCQMLSFVGAHQITPHLCTVKSTKLQHGVKSTKLQPGMSQIHYVSSKTSLHHTVNAHTNIQHNHKCFTCKSQYLL